VPNGLLPAHLAHLSSLFSTHTPRPLHPSPHYKCGAAAAATIAEQQSSRHRHPCLRPLASRTLDTHIRGTRGGERERGPLQRLVAAAGPAPTDGPVQRRRCRCRGERRRRLSNVGEGGPGSCLLLPWVGGAESSVELLPSRVSASRGGFLGDGGGVLCWGSTDAPPPSPDGRDPRAAGRFVSFDLAVDESWSGGDLAPGAAPACGRFG
jgi:hypothetical protein